MQTGVAGTYLVAGASALKCFDKKVCADASGGRELRQCDCELLAALAEPEPQIATDKRTHLLRHAAAEAADVDYIQVRSTARLGDGIVAGRCRSVAGLWQRDNFSCRIVFGLGDYMPNTNNDMLNIWQSDSSTKVICFVISSRTSHFHMSSC